MTNADTISVIRDEVFDLAKRRRERQEAALGAMIPEPFVPPVFIPK